jgi:tetratricopeptide repeat protein
VHKKDIDCKMVADTPSSWGNAMPTETLIERAYTLVHRDRPDEARPVLGELFRANANDAEAWALMAEIAPTEATREEALRKVADFSADNRLTEWAINELSRLKGLGGSGPRKEPPLPSVADSWGSAASASLESWSRQEVSTPRREAVELPPISAKPERKALAGKAGEGATPVVTVKPLPGDRASAPGGTGFMIRTLGGWIMTLGVIVFIGAVISEPFNHLLIKQGIPMGWVAIAVTALGLLTTGVGYLLRD